jgi:hypothetical protein
MPFRRTAQVAFGAFLVFFAAWLLLAFVRALTGSP